MRSSPQAAPPRPDLDWLRHRTRRVPAGPPTPSATVGSAGSSSSALADVLAGRTTRRRPYVTAPAPAPAPTRAPAQVAGADELDLSAPAPQRPAPASDLDLSNDLDLSAPTPPRPAPAPSLDLSGDLDLSAPAPARSAPASDLDLSNDLDLSAPAPPRPAPASDLDLSNDLDLSAPAPPRSAPSGDLDLFPEPAPPPVPAQPRPTPVVRTVPRVAPGGRVILTPREPVVTLDRLQSGMGGLTVTAVCSPAVGDLVLGAVYQLADGTSGVVSRVAGIPTAPPRTRRPVLEATRGEFEQISVDLRQARALRRFVVYATSASETELSWGGTLRLATHGGSRVEIPLDLERHAGPVVVASLYVVDGEFVVRAELDPVHGVARDVALAYGYGAITWADARTPVL